MYFRELADFSREFRAETAAGEVVHRINTSVLEKWLHNNSSVSQLPDYLFADETQAHSSKAFCICDQTVMQ